MDDQNWRAPSVPEREQIVWDEPGRVLLHQSRPDSNGQRVCYRAYHYRVTRPDFGLWMLRVKHGGGEECFPLAHNGDPVLAALAALDSDSRFAMLHALREMRNNGTKLGGAEMRSKYAQAFIDGRLKKRKIRGRAEVNVWIEAAPTAPAVAAVAP